MSVSRILGAITVVVGIAIGMWLIPPRMEHRKIESRIGERFSNLNSIRSAQIAYHYEHQKYMPCKPSPSNGGTDSRPDKWVDAGGFSEIGFLPDRDVLYQYSVVVSDDGNFFTVYAVGDIDEDGQRVTFSLDLKDSTITRYPQYED